MITNALKLAASAMLVTSISFAAVLNQSKTSDFKISVIKVGRQPKGMEITPDGAKLFIANLMGEKIGNEYKASVDVVNMKTLQKTNTIITPTNPRIGPMGIIGNAEVAITAEGKYVLVSRTEGKKEAEVYDRAMLNVIDAKTDMIAGFVPLKASGAKIIAIRPGDTPEKSFAYVTNWFSEDIAVVSLAEVYANTNTNAPKLIPSALAKNIRLYSAWPNPQKEENRKPGDTRELDAFKVAPRGVAFTADGKYAIAIGYASGTLFVIDAQTHNVLAETAPVPGGLNLRHIVIAPDGRKAFISHMRGDALSAIDLDSLIREVHANQNPKKKITLLDGTIWNKILIPWKNTGLPFMRTKEYPAEMPTKNYRNGPARYTRAEPNTILLDHTGKYLMVSCRSSDRDAKGGIIHQYGKVDIVDTETGDLVISLVGGLAPTALAISKDNRVLVSSGFEDQTIHFYDFAKIIATYKSKTSLR